MDDSGVRLHKMIEIVGRHLSTTEIWFSHEQPLSNKRAIVVIASGNDRTVELEIEVIWSKRLSMGMYETGCRLVRKVG
jgi:hypothetical protein